MERNIIAIGLLFSVVINTVTVGVIGISGECFFEWKYEQNCYNYTVNCQRL